MADRSKKSGVPTDIYLSLAIKFSPIWAPSLIAIIFVFIIGWPMTSKLFSLSRNIAQDENDLVTADRSTADVAKMREDLEIFKKKVMEFENRLPKRMKTNLIIETLQEITKKSKLKFSSLEPLSIKKHKLEETKDVFVELPVKVNLNCGYYDLIDFLKKIETASQLMKVADLNIRDDPLSDWEHSVEFTISTFSKGDNDD